VYINQTSILKEILSESIQWKISPFLQEKDWLQKFVQCRETGSYQNEHAGCRRKKSAVQKTLTSLWKDLLRDRVCASEG